MTPAEQGQCEECRAAFTSDRIHAPKYRRMPDKRFCSERCRKRAEGKRARARKAAGNGLG